jgi:hypothetical protein
MSDLFVLFNTCHDFDIPRMIFLNLSDKHSFMLYEIFQSKEGLLHIYLHYILFMYSVVKLCAIQLQVSL